VTRDTALDSARAAGQEAPSESEGEPRSEEHNTARSAKQGAGQSAGRNIALTIAYDGTDYFGFQSQAGAGLPTIQEALETAVSRLTGERVHVEGSGRTDTGVHAWGQVVNFITKSPIPPERWRLALPPYLPDDIIVRESVEALPCFHARFHALSKTYIYQFYTGPAPSPFLSRYSCHAPYKLDIPAMSEAAAGFEGSHDFRGFCAAGSKVKNHVRDIYSCEIILEDPLLKLIVRGNGFLTHMVRTMGGTLLEVGMGKRSPDDIPRLLRLRDRRLSGVTLAARGLILDRVQYDEAMFPG